jgi:hypothetical protein
MTTPTDGEWMRVEDALAFLGMGHTDAIDAICLRAYNRLIKAKAEQYIDGTGRHFANVELPPEFWWSAREIENWRTGDLATTSPDSGARLQAFGVTFRRLDIERMVSPAPQGANGASLSSTQTRAGSKVPGADIRLAPRALGQHATIGEAMLTLSVLTTPTDGEWMSAHEALQFLQQPAADAKRAICTRAHAGMIGARARRYVSYGQSEDDVETFPANSGGRRVARHSKQIGRLATSR